MGKPEGKGPFGRPKRKWEDNIEIYLQKNWMGGRRLDWSGSGQGQAADCCEHDNEPSSFTKLRELLYWLIKRTRSFIFSTLTRTLT